MSKKLCSLIVMLGILSALICVGVYADDYNSITSELLKEGFETERLIANKTEATDIPILAEYLLSKKITDYWLPSVVEGFSSKKESAEFLNEFLVKKNAYRFTVRLKDSGTPIGMISYSKIENDVLNVGYWIAEAYHNNRYMSEVVIPLTKMIFEGSKDLKTLQIECAFENKASDALAQKICKFINPDNTKYTSTYDVYIVPYECKYKYRSWKIFFLNKII